MIYSIDFETRSNIDLTDRGLDIYANDPSTEAICIAFGTTPDNVVVSKANSKVLTSELLDHVRNGGKVQAWNAMFEYTIWNCVCVPNYGWPELKLNQVIDSMAIAAANNIPQSLDDAGSFINADHQKDPIGKKLIQKLCKPNKEGVFNKDVDLLAQLFEYCKKDVLAEMSIVSKLRPLSADEQKVWELTQRINIRGVPVDPKELRNAVLAVKNAQARLDEELTELTGCKPSERSQTA
jgi:DNA polymerase